jgi:hypothetical protein
MASSDSLPSQIDFGYLSVPELHHVTLAHNTVDHDAFSRSGSSSSVKSTSLEHDVSVHVICTSPELYAPLAIVEVLSVYHADAFDASGVRTVGRLDSTEDRFSTRQILLDDMYDPARSFPSIAPPKKFFRTFWRSISLRLLHRQAHTVTQLSSKPDYAPIAQGC